MAGELQSFVFGGILLLMFSLVAVQLVSVAADEGEFSSVEFPMFNQTDQYLQDSKDFGEDFQAAVQEVSDAPPGLSIAQEGFFGASVILKATTFTVKTLTLVLNIFTTAVTTIASTFGIPSWVLAIGITTVTLMFAFAILAVVTRYPV